jgi:hypothetical protein
MNLIKFYGRAAFLFLTGFVLSLAAMAQDSGGSGEGGADINVDINKDGGGAAWYNSPVV